MFLQARVSPALSLLECAAESTSSPHDANTKRSETEAERDGKEIGQDRRGCHENRGKKVTFANAVHEHRVQAEAFKSGEACHRSCRFGGKCSEKLTSANMVLAHKSMFLSSSVGDQPRGPASSKEGAVIGASQGAPNPFDQELS